MSRVSALFWFWSSWIFVHWRSYCFIDMPISAMATTTSAKRNASLTVNRFSIIESLRAPVSRRARVQPGPVLPCGSDLRRLALRVKYVAQPVAHEVEAQQRHDQQNTRK